jgi:hypothetical protein
LLSALVCFYEAHPSEPVVLHILGSSAVKLGDFWADSEPFARIGEEVCPVDVDGVPTSEMWVAYAEGCRDGVPPEVCTELWVDAHVADLARVREMGLDAQFEREAAAHEDVPSWRWMRDHMRMSLGARAEDHLVWSGDWASESAFATGLMRALRRMAAEGGPMFWRYARAWLAAVSHAGPPQAEISDRRVAWLVLRSTVGAARTFGLVRRGVRLKARGRRAEGDRWPLIQQTLGQEAAAVHPNLVRFYENPGAWDCTATLECHGWATRWALDVVRRLTRQGLAEVTLGKPWPARFRTFCRADGTMHFIREIWVDGVLRVFDSNFLVGRDVEGRAAVIEYFPDLDVTVPLCPEVHEGDGLSMVGRRQLWRGWCLPRAVQVRFDGRALEGEALEFAGRATLDEGAVLGRLARWVGMPAELGVLRYRATPAAVTD